MDEQNKNLILATALSFLVIIVWTLFFAPEPEIIPEPTAESATQTAAQPSDDLASAPPPEGGETSLDVSLTGTSSTREGALATTDRLEIRTSRLVGSMGAN